MEVSTYSFVVRSSVFNGLLVGSNGLNELCESYIFQTVEYLRGVRLLQQQKEIPQQEEVPVEQGPMLILSDLMCQAWCFMILGKVLVCVFYNSIL